MIPCQRQLFDLPDDVVYLNCAYLAPKLLSVVQAGAAGIERERRPWQIVARHFFDDSEHARSLFARIIGATADDVAIIPAASYGIATAAANIPVSRGERIVLLAEQYPSNVYAWRDLASNSGAEIVTVPRPPDGNWTPALIDCITRDTAVVAIPNIHYTDGSYVDLMPVRDRCRSVAAALVLDLSQSTGVMPYSVTELEPDFIVTAGYKWLLGPYGIGFMYVSPDHQTGTPIEFNWLNRKASDDFAALVDYRDEYQVGARRFDVGERAKFTQMPMAIAALEQITGWGVKNIAATLAARTGDIARRAQDLGLRMTAEKFRAPHIVGLRFPRGVPDGLLDRLARHKVYVSLRGDSMRVAPYLCNDDRDIDRLFDVLTACLRDKT